MATSRSDPGGGALGFAMVFLAFVFGGILHIPAPVYLLLVAGGTLLAVRSAGLTGFGLAALIFAIIIFGMPLVTSRVFGRGALRT